MCWLFHRWDKWLEPRLVLYEHGTWVQIQERFCKRCNKYEVKYN